MVDIVVKLRRPLKRSIALDRSGSAETGRNGWRGTWEISGRSLIRAAVRARRAGPRTPPRRQPCTAASACATRSERSAQARLTRSTTASTIAPFVGERLYPLSCATIPAMSPIPQCSTIWPSARRKMSHEVPTVLPHSAPEITRQSQPAKFRFPDHEMERPEPRVPRLRPRHVV